ncbi:hypothetical protein PSP30_gp9c [Pseudomonas phage PSP30]|nr:hypothetical protein PSP30_gp9c [Pseudomonas phage PSP30]
MYSPYPYLGQRCTLSPQPIQLQGFTNVASARVSQLTDSLGNLAVDGLDGLHVPIHLSVVIAFHGMVSLIDFPRRPSLQP